MKIKVHIGNPKAYSTFFQSYFYQAERNNEITYTGFRPDSDFRKWYRSGIESEILNQGMRFDSEYHFNNNLNKYKIYIEEKYNECSQASIDWVLSSENIGSKWLTNDIDTSVKLKRLQTLITEPKEIVVCFRNLKCSLLSIYTELVNQGYTGSIKDFLTESYWWRKFNFIDSLFPHISLSQLQYLLDAGNEVTFVYSNNLPITKKTLQIFGISENGLGPGYLNKGVHYVEAEDFANANKKSSIGVNMSGMLELHRYYWAELDNNDTFWKYRRAIINSRNTKSRHREADTLNTEFDRILNTSELKYYLQEQIELCGNVMEKNHKNVVQIGSISELWQGI